MGAGWTWQGAMKHQLKLQYLTLMPDQSRPMGLFLVTQQYSISLSNYPMSAFDCANNPWHSGLHEAISKVMTTLEMRPGPLTCKMVWDCVTDSAEVVQVCPT